MTTANERRLEAEQEAATIKRILMSPDGQKLYEFLSREYMERTSHVAGDPYTTAFREGQRNVVLILLDLRESEYELQTSVIEVT